MSNFYCKICNTSILENEQGNYVTYCEHYPLERLNSKSPFEKIMDDIYSGRHDYRRKL